MSDGFADAAHWAREVQESEPHDLGVLEEHVLGRGPGSEVQLARSRPTSLKESATFVAALLVLMGPLGAATVFWDRSDAVRLGYYFDNSFAFPAATVGCLLGLVWVVLAVLDWIRNTRRRDAALISISVIVSLCSLLAALQGTARSYVGPPPEWVYLGPMWITVLVGLISATMGVLAPSKDRDQAQATKARQRLRMAKIKAAGGDLDTLHQVYVEALLDDRRRALEILASRGMLDPATNVHTLAMRPLGQLPNGTEDTS